LCFYVKKHLKSSQRGVKLGKDELVVVSQFVLDFVCVWGGAGTTVGLSAH
jgi:hypothetical protein